MVLRELPSGYKQVEYVKNTKSKQYVDTGVCPTAATDIRLRGFVDSSKSGTKSLFGTRSGEANTPSTGLTGGKTSINVYSLSRASSAKALTLRESSNDIIYETEGRVFDYNGLGGYFEPALVDSIDYPIYLLGIDNQGALLSNTYTTDMRIYGMQIYEQGICIRDFVPCVRESDQHVGFYDLADHSSEPDYEPFYENANASVADLLGAGDEVANVPFEVSFSEEGLGVLTALASASGLVPLSAPGSVGGLVLGSTVQCRAPSDVFEVSPVMKFHVTGYKLYEVDFLGKETLIDAKDSLSVDYTCRDGVAARLEWQIAVDSTATSSAGAFKKQMEITVPDKSVGAEAVVTNFVALVRLSEEIEGFHYSDFSLSNGQDLMFKDEDGTVLAHEVDTWDASGTSLVWVRIPFFTRATKLMMHYGNGAVSGLAKTDAWSDYGGVWHFREENGTAFDSTAHGLDGTPSEGEAHGVLASSDGVVGTSRRNYPYSSSKAEVHRCHMELPDYDELAYGDTFDVSFWFKCYSDSWGGLNYNLLFRNSGWDVSFPLNSTLTLSVKGAGNGFSAPMSPVVNKWAYVTVSFHGTTADVYTNGVFSASGTLSKAAVANGKVIEIGRAPRYAEGDVDFSCQYDEVRLSGGRATADSVAADYATMTDASFFTYGAAEDTPEDPVLTVPSVTWSSTDGFSVDCELTQGAAEISVAYESGTVAVTNSFAGGAVQTGPVAIRDVPTNLADNTVYRVIVLARTSSGVFAAEAQSGLYTGKITIEKTADAIYADPGVFTVRRAEGTDSTWLPIVVAYEVGGTSEPGADYKELPGFVTIEAGESAAMIPVSTLKVQTSETELELTLAEGGSYAVSEEKTTAKIFVVTARDGLNLNWTGEGDGRDFNLRTNWDPQYAPESNDTVQVCAPSAGLSLAETKNTRVKNLYFTDEDENAGTAALDFGDHTLDIVTKLYFQGADTALSNGLLTTPAIQFGGSYDGHGCTKAGVSFSGITMPPATWSVASGATYDLTITDSVISNTQRSAMMYALADNSSVTLDHSYFYTSDWIYGSAKSNTTFHITNCSTVECYYAMQPQVRYSRIVIDGNSRVIGKNRDNKFAADANACGNVFAISNSYYSGEMTVNGRDGTAYVHDSSVGNIGVSAVNGRLYITGTNAEVRGGSVTFSSTNGYVSLLDAKQPGKVDPNGAFAFAAESARNTFRLGKCGDVCSLNILRTYTNSFDNAIVVEGGGSMKFSRANEPNSNFAFNGQTNRWVIKDGTITVNPLSFSALPESDGCAIECADDAAKMTFTSTLSAGNDDPCAGDAIFRFFPGATGFGGAAPMTVADTATIRSNVVFEVNVANVTDETPRKVPLVTFKKNPSWDLERVLSNARTAPAGFGKFSYNDKTRTLVYHKAIGLMILVR